MERRVLAALASSLVSHAVVLLLLPSSSSSSSLLLSPKSKSKSMGVPPPAEYLFPLLYFLSSSSSSSLKRKRSSSPLNQSLSKSESESESEFVGPSIDSIDDLTVTVNPDQFRLSFRMTSSTFEYLSGLLEPLLDCGPLLRPVSRLAIALFRLSTGCPYLLLSRQFGVPEPTARSCTKRLCRVLCTNFRFWLTFPSSSSDLHPVSSSFSNLPNGLPNCCGAILSTSFTISDGTSVVTQVVSDPSCRILNLATGHRGLRSSSLYRDVEAGRLIRAPYYLIGGAGYPLLPWLMPPFHQALPNSKEDAFNVAHSIMLRPASRTMMSLRNWGILKGSILDEERKMALACIGTCSILHNVLLMREDYSALSDGIVDNLDDYGTKDQSFFDGLEIIQSMVEKEASEVRLALAAKARECCVQLRSPMTRPKSASTNRLLEYF